jgi:hypothetical protein
MAKPKKIPEMSATATTSPYSNIILHNNKKARAVLIILMWEL